MPTSPVAWLRFAALLVGASCVACADMFGLDSMDLKTPPDAGVDANAHGGSSGAGGHAGDAAPDVNKPADAAQEPGEAQAEAGEDVAELDSAPVDALPEAEAEAGCPPGEKDCSGDCVATNQPSTGCSSASCDPCQVPNASPMCDSNLKCVIAACVLNFEDCNYEASDGCEVSLKTDASNCGSCSHVCAQDFVCSGGNCACSGDDSCNAGSSGSCASGACVCGASTCAAGQRCLANGTCG